MCTISIVAASGLVRLVCNRDEQRTRPGAAPPRRHQAGPRQAMYPVDPAGPGTWIGVNDAGLAAVVLNTTPVGRVLKRGSRSRGLIVPAVLESTWLEEAVTRAVRLAREDFSAFRLVVVHRRRLAIVRGGGGERPQIQGQTLQDPLLLASSSLGDRLVEPLRRQLFDELLAAERDPLVAQLLLHTHAWHSRPHVSVMMRRRDACTVSRTRVDIADDDNSTITYEALAMPETAVHAWAS